MDDLNGILFSFECNYLQLSTTSVLLYKMFETVKPSTNQLAPDTLVELPEWIREVSWKPTRQFPKDLANLNKNVLALKLKVAGNWWRPCELT